MESIPYTFKMPIIRKFINHY
ncbi:hypothetical protein CCACVL1_23232, partial [Corchorus capsularis]